MRPESLTLAFHVETQEEAEAAAAQWAAAEPNIFEASIVSATQSRLGLYWSVVVAIVWREEAPTLGLLA